MITFFAMPPVGGCGPEEITIEEGQRLRIWFEPLAEVGVEESDYEPFTCIETEDRTVVFSIEIPAGMWLSWEAIADNDTHN